MAAPCYSGNAASTWDAMLDLYIDADACPVKEEAYRVARRYDLKVLLVSNRGLRAPADLRAETVMVGDALDAADDWIAERIGPGDIVVTADIPLAARCVRKGARAVTPQGRHLTEANAGTALAARDLMTHLRETGAVTGGGPPPLARQDRSRFLMALDEAVQAIRRRTGAPSSIAGTKR